jgi:hypothetical protein
MLALPHGLASGQALVHCCRPPLSLSLSLAPVCCCGSFLFELCCLCEGMQCGCQPHKMTLQSVCYFLVCCTAWHVEVSREQALHCPA